MKTFLGAMLLVYGAAAYGQVITLKAKDYDGKTTYFVQREANWENEAVWGIKGEGTTGEVHTGDMWFNSFSGVTGEYKVEFGVVLEPDGDPQYAVTAGSRLLKTDRYPYPTGQSTYQCSGGSSEKHWIDLGNHTINNGEKINVWGKSLYYCGEGTSWHGAYTRWFELKFTKVDGSGVHNSLPGEAAPVFNLAAGPGLLTSAVTVSFNLPTPGYATVTLMRGNGDKMATLSDGFHTAGPQELRLKRTASMKAGVYYLVLTHDAGTQVARIIAVD